MIDSGCMIFRIPIRRGVNKAMLQALVDSLPDDALITGIRWPMDVFDVVILAHSEEFPKMPEGAICPQAELMITMVDTDVPVEGVAENELMRFKQEIKYHWEWRR